MAKGKKTGGRDFEKGDERAGRPRLPGDVREARKFTSGEVQRVLTEFMHMTPTELAERLTSGDATMLEGFIGSIMQRGIKDGCPTRLNFLFERTIGKVKDQLEVSLPKPFVITDVDGNPKATLGSKVEKEE
jgi:hypothetical protein